MTNTWYCKQCNDIQTGPNWQLNNLGTPISDQLADPRCKCGEIMVPGQPASEEYIEPDVIEQAKVTNIVAPADIKDEDQCYWRKRLADMSPTSNIIITVPKQ